jgi:hypothetical protein
MYMETTHGYYDILLSWFGSNSSILPMNINMDAWGSAWGTRAQLLDAKNNILAGALILKGIQANVQPGASVAEIATLYNSLNATRVTTYGARVEAIYNTKPWNK